MQHKNAHNEDFPVDLLVQKKLRPLVAAYYEAARYADDIADSPFLTAERKMEKLAEIRSAFMQPDGGNDLQIIRGLGRLFVVECLDASLFLDLLTAFERDAVNRPIRIWEELTDYCRYSAAPVGRFMLAIHNENPSAYLPAENLCTILQLLNHLADIKEDLSLLQRCYIPEDMMNKYKVRITDLGLQNTLPQVRQLLSEIMLKVEKMQADAELLPALINNFRLRLNVCVILSLTNSVIKKYINTDILQNPPHPSRLDWIKAFFQGTYKALFCKKTHQRTVI